MEDEISQAISESIADLPGSDADAAIDTTSDAPATETTEVAAAETSAETASTETPAEGQHPVRPVSRSQLRIQQLANERKALEEKYEAERKAWEEERESLAWARQDPNAKLLFDGLKLMDTDPKRFVEGVLLQDERYAGLIALKQAQQQAAAESDARGSDLKEPEFPEADVQFADGTPGHSPQVIAKYMRDVATYVAQTTGKNYEEKIAGLEKRLKPFEERVAADEAIDRHTRNVQQEWDREAKTYGLTKDDQKELHAWMKEQWRTGNPKAGIADAIRAVVVPRILKERDDARAQKLQSADAAHAQTVAARNTAALAAERAPAGAGGKGGGEESVEDVIRAAIRNHPDR